MDTGALDITVVRADVIPINDPKLGRANPQAMTWLKEGYEPSKDSFIAIASCLGRNVGAIVLRMEYTAAPEDRVYVIVLSGLFVDEAYRRRHVATALMNEGYRWKAENYPRLSLIERARLTGSDPAYIFLAEQGFKEDVSEILLHPLFYAA